MSTSKTPEPSVDLGYPTEPSGDIPAFNSIEEEAEYWDTHDHYTLEELDPAALHDGVELHGALTLRLESGDRAALDRRAKELGVEPATLVHRWIKEHLRREAS